VDDRSYPTGISVGIPPTFPNAHDLLEAHLIGYEGDLYGREILLEFVERIRDQRKFATDAELSQAVESDIDYVSRTLGGEVA
jgi:riboflavin kinase/FMN adenylyltransferase